jgi:hypothetical protein
VAARRVAAEAAAKAMAMLMRQQLQQAVVTASNWALYETSWPQRFRAKKYQ